MLLAFYQVCKLQLAKGCSTYGHIAVHELTNYIQTRPYLLQEAQAQSGIFNILVFAGFDMAIMMIDASIQNKQSA